MDSNSPQKQEGALLGLLFTARGQMVARRDLAQRSGIAPEELEARLASYVEAGYPVKFHPQGGIGLDEPPDIWSAEEILGRCPARENLPAWNPLLLAETASTNDVAREQGRKGARAGFLVAARGRRRGAGGSGAVGNPPRRGDFTFPCCCARTWR